MRWPLHCVMHWADRWLCVMWGPENVTPLPYTWGHADLEIHQRHHLKVKSSNFETCIVSPLSKSKSLFCHTRHCKLLPCLKTYSVSKHNEERLCFILFHIESDRCIISGAATSGCCVFVEARAFRAPYDGLPIAGFVLQEKWSIWMQH